MLNRMPNLVRTTCNSSLSFIILISIIVVVVANGKKDADPIQAAESENRLISENYAAPKAGAEADAEATESIMRANYHHYDNNNNNHHHHYQQQQQQRHQYNVGEKSNQAQPSIASSNTAYFTKPMTMKLSQDEMGEIYKKAASEYYPNEATPHMSEYPMSGNEYGNDAYGSSGYGNGGGYNDGSNGGGYGLNQDHGYQKGKEISITPDHKPITLHYRTHSQPIVVHQTRIPGPKPEVKHSRSQEEPHRVVHEVLRPIIQEVHEIIQPYRRVVQQIEPVVEEVRTVIAKDAGKSGGGQGGMQPRGHYSGMSHSESARQMMIARKPTIPYKLLATKPAIHFDRQTSASEPIRQAMSSKTSNSLLPRSKVFFDNRGVPVYQSNYMGPAIFQSS